MDIMQIYQEEETNKLYIVLNGEKYYFERKYVDTPYTTRDAEIDRLRIELTEAANIELSSQSHRKDDGHYENIGLLPNGNMIVSLNGDCSRYGVVSSSGDVLVDFKYSQIRPLINKNGEIVHDGCFIVKSGDHGYVPDSGFMKDNFSYYKGIVFENGKELFPIGTKNIDDIGYDSEKDVLHFNCTEYWCGLFNAKGWSGYNNDLMTISGTDLDDIINQIRVENNPKTR